MQFTLRPATDDDLEWLVELRADVMRPDLERLGRYDPDRVRQRLRDEFTAHHTRVIVVGGADVGSIALRQEADIRWVEHFYLSPAMQGRGVGTAILRDVLEEDGATPFRLNVLAGSAAGRLYTRLGFAVDSDDGIDVFMTRPALAPPVRLPAE